MTAATESRLDELLLLRATQRLTDAERIELDDLLASGGGETMDVYERTAAAVHVAALHVRAEMPRALRVRIEREALRYLRARERPRSGDSPER